MPNAVTTQTRLGISGVLLAVTTLAVLLAVGVGPVTASNHCDRTVNPGGSIQEDGIDAAAPGETVCVTAWKYNERLTIDKSLTLLGEPGVVLDGEDAQASAITIAGGVSGVVIEGFIIRNYAHDPLVGGIGSGVHAWNADPNNDITVRNNRFENLGWSAVLVGNEGEALHSNWTVENNVAVDVGTFIIELTNTVDSSITNNRITGGTAYGQTTFAGIMVQAQVLAGEGLTVSNVRVDRNTVNGTVTHAGIHVVAWDESSSQQGAQVRSVQVVGNNVSGAAHGLEAETRGGNTAIGEMNVTENGFSHNGIGIHTRGFGPESDITIKFNKILRNDVGVKNPSPETLDARCNYWGHAQGPKHSGNSRGGDSIAEDPGDILFERWMRADNHGQRVSCRNWLSRQ